MPYLILVDKPQGVTSFGAVAALRRKLGEKRIGHTGTLDPMATGVLPLLTGRASRLCSLMLDGEKEYTATVRLGTTTDTLDITGTVLSQSKVCVSDSELENALARFRGDIMQVPPMYSALKSDGVRLYKLAREGVEVKREPRAVTIYELKLLSRENDTDFTISVRCSKGTYIRTLADDIGKALGTGATLVALRRTYAAGFGIESCTPLEDIKADESGSFLLSPELCVMHLPQVTVTYPQAVRFMHGGKLSTDRLHGAAFNDDGELYRIKYGDEFLGIGKLSLATREMAVTCVICEELRGE